MIRVTSSARLKIASLAFVATAALAIPAANADPIPTGWIAKNLVPIGYSDMGGRPGAVKMVIHHAANNHWYVYTSHTSDFGFGVIDVTDVKNPRYVKFVPTPKYSGTDQLTLHDNLLISGVAQENNIPPWPRGDAKLESADSVPMERGTKIDIPAAERPAGGVILWDISDSENPKQISYWKNGSASTHRNYYPGGKYAYLSSNKPGFRNLVLDILDVSDPAHPKEAGFYAEPNQLDSAPMPADGASSFHGPPQISPDGKLMTASYSPYFIVFDNSDPVHPKPIGKLPFGAPFRGLNNSASALHTDLTLWDRKIAIINSEAVSEHCDQLPLMHQSIIDFKDPKKPRLMATFPLPMPPAEEVKRGGYKNYCDKGGRSGPHNVSQEIHNPDVQQPGNLIFTAWFNAGLRVHDISDPRYPTEVGYFIQANPKKRLGWWPASALRQSAEDVIVDARGYIYLSDRQYGLTILKYTGTGMPVPTAK